jgi:adenosylcobinamide-phosphate synthase
VVKVSFGWGESMFIYRKALRFSSLVLLMDVLVLLPALVLDFFAREPPSRFHPVVWLGKTVEFFDGKWKRNPKLDFTAGTFLLCFILILAYLLACIPSLLPYPLSYVMAAYLLFSSISIRSMVEHARLTIQNNRVLAENVQRIVSRNTAKLNQHQLSSAVVESVAENFVDGVLAPLLYFSIFGIHGAVVYRAINLCDALIGYRSEKYLYFGKAAARLDDVANFIPARLSVLLFSLLSLEAINAYREKVKLNGHAIVAMAYVLGVKLEKPGHYVVNCNKEPDVKDIKKSITVFWKLCVISIALVLLISFLKHLAF